MNVKVEQLAEIARKAGDAIMDIYQGSDEGFGVEQKSDESPLTLADKAAHKIINEQLAELYPEVPLISEEGNTLSYEERSNWDLFWLVDPLDGTKEFIKRNGEFTVNIALIKNNQPIIGVIYAPAIDVLYHGTLLLGAYKISNGITERIQVANRKAPLTAVGSRSHSATSDEEQLAKYNIKDFIPMGSSLKFCLVAEGKADLYIRTQPTMEWDTAAGHAIVLAAGGKVEGLRYNKENLLNSGFKCLGFE